MRASINQKPSPLRLPELRNLGTVLRIVLAVNALGLLAVFAREETWGRLAAVWFETAAVLEPPLMVNLLVLYAAAPWLESLHYRVAAAAIAALAVIATLGVDLLLAALHVELGATDMLRHAAFALLAASLLLFYFHLRAKALSPAITEARLQA